MYLKYKKVLILTQKYHDETLKSAENYIKIKTQPTFLSLVFNTTIAHYSNILKTLGFKNPILIKI